MVAGGKGFKEGKYFKVGNNGKYMSDEINTVEDLYNLHKSGGNDSSAESNDKSNEINLYNGAVTGYNPNQPQCSGGFYDAEQERRWKERAAAINAQRRLEKKIETKIYKRLIKELLKKI